MKLFNLVDTIESLESRGTLDLKERFWGLKVLALKEKWFNSCVCTHVAIGEIRVDRETDNLRDSEKYIWAVVTHPGEKSLIWSHWNCMGEGQNYC